MQEVEATSAESPFRKFGREGHEGIEAKASGKNLKNPLSGKFVSSLKFYDYNH